MRSTGTRLGGTYWRFVLGLIATVLALLAGFWALLPSLFLARWIVLAVTAIAGAGSVLFLEAPKSRIGVSTATWAVGGVLVLWGLTIPLGDTPVFSTLKWGALCTQVIVFVYFGGQLLTEADWWKIFSYSFAFLSIPVVLACITLLLGQNPLWPHPVFVHGRLAALTNPNTLAVIITSCGGVALWMLEVYEESDRKSEWKRRGVFLLLGLSIFALYMTGSRSSSVGFLGGATVWAFCTRRTFWVGTAFILAVGMFVFSDPDPVQPQVRNQGGGLREDPYRTEELTQSREEVWAASYEKWKERPWFGYGYGRTGQDFTLRSYISAPTATRDGSGYLGLLESVGLVGGLALAWLYLVLGTYIWEGARAWRRGRRTMPLWILLISGTVFVTLAIQGMGEPWIIGPGSFMHMFFWLSIGAVMWAHNTLVQAEQAPTDTSSQRF